MKTLRVAAASVLLIAYPSLASTQTLQGKLVEELALAREPEPSQEKPASKTVEAKDAKLQQLELGRSVLGRAITATVHGAGKMRVIVIGGIHGDETATPVVARALAASLERNPAPVGLTVIVVPEANPDGVAARTRVNARGVDINRSFPAQNWRADYKSETRYPGTEPSTEPETRALIALIQRYSPDLVITIHAALGCLNWDGPAREMARVMALKNNYPLCPYLGYETPGSLGSYVGVDKSVPTPTIELQATDSTRLVRDNLPALRAALDYFFSLHCCSHTDKFQPEETKKPAP